MYFFTNQHWSVIDSNCIKKGVVGLNTETSMNLLKTTLWTQLQAGKRIKTKTKHMNQNKALLQLWQPNHVTNQTLPIHLSQSNWPFLKLSSVTPTPWPSFCLSLTLSLSFSVFLSSCLFSGRDRRAREWLQHLLVMLMQGQRRGNLGSQVINQSTRRGLGRAVEAQSETGESKKVHWPRPQLEISLMHNVKPSYRKMKTLETKLHFKFWI